MRNSFSKNDFHPADLCFCEGNELLIFVAYFKILGIYFSNSFSSLFKFFMLR